VACGFILAFHTDKKLTKEISVLDRQNVDTVFNLNNEGTAVKMLQYRAVMRVESTVNPLLVLLGQPPAAATARSWAK
jgi:hypothetical protein